MIFDERETANILAGLRLLQDKVESGDMADYRRLPHFDTTSVLSGPEIDVLCERITFETEDGAAMGDIGLHHFFTWCADNLSGFERQQCDESEHFYLHDMRIGGFAGDRQAYFIDSNPEFDRARRMMLADKGL